MDNICLSSQHNNILVIDDDDNCQKAIHNILTCVGYSYTGAQNGKDGLRLAEEIIPDVILLDISMPPGIDGFEVCRILKSLEKTKHIPILFLTSHADSDNIIQAFRAGAADYITKPVELRELHSRLEIQLEILKLKHNLSKNEYWLNKAQNIAHIGYWVWEMQTQALNWSDEIYRIFELDPSKFQPSTEAFEKRIHPDDLEFFLKQRDAMLNKKGDAYIEHRIICPDGKIKHVIERAETILNKEGAVHCVIGTVQDVTEFIKMQFQVMHNEKLAAIGQLASGIAHEFNNILAIAYSNIQFIDLLKENVSEDMKQSHNIIEEALLRGKNIVADLISFTQYPEPNKKIISIEESIDSVLILMDIQFKTNNIEVEKKFDNKKYAHADPGQFEQVFMNLITNAQHALMPKNGGKISIATEQINGNIRIMIRDTGVGIDDNDQSKIFNPFFTTKGAFAKNNLNIKGTGLGLPICYSIVKNHNGKISFQSRKNIGTEFEIIIPACETDESVIVTKKEISVDIEKHQLHGLKILLIDDEPQLVNIMQRIFSINKINVTGCLTGELAIEKILKYEYDIIFIDMLLPDMNGEEIFNQIKKSKPDLPVVFISGQIGIEKERLLKLGATAFVQKPFNFSEVLELIKKITAQTLKTVDNK